MSVDANKAVIHRLADEVWNGGSRHAAEELLAAERVDRQLSHLAHARRSRPDIRWSIEDLVAEGDKEAIRWTSSGTHTEEWHHPLTGRVAPTGKRVTNTGITIFRLANGKVVEHWELSNLLGLFQQLGATMPPVTGGEGGRGSASPPTESRGGP